MGVEITYQQSINEKVHKTKITKCKHFKENVYDETDIKNLRFRLKEENERNKTISNCDRCGDVSIATQ